MAQKDKSSKCRSPNYSDEEKVFLLERIRNIKHVIETRRKDYKSNAQKVAAWNEIAEQRNSHFPDCKRTVEQLKMFWNRTKVNAIKESSAAKKSVKKTGGGPSDAPKMSVGTDIVMEIVGDSADPMHNNFDDDADDDTFSVPRKKIAKTEESLERETWDNQQYISEGM